MVASRLAMSPTAILLLLAFEILLLAYTYKGYALVLRLFRLRHPLPSPGEHTYRPPVSIIIAGYNEEKNIEAKIENCYALDYPPEKLEVIFCSDGSTDRSCGIVRSLPHPRLLVIERTERAGKQAAQKAGIDAASGEILVFTDVAARVRPEALLRVLSHFNDPRVGCITGADVTLVDEHDSTGEEGYIDYEMTLRRLESERNTVTGMSGAFFAVRKDLCGDFSPVLDSDFDTLLRCCRKGFRGVFDPGLRILEPPTRSLRSEFWRRVRTVVRGMDVLWKRKALLNPVRHPMLSWQLFSHKVLRWLSPWTLLAIFLTTLWASLHYPFLWVFFVLQAAGILVGILGMSLPALRAFRPVKMATLLFSANLAVALALLKYLGGERYHTWQPTKRSGDAKG